MNIFGIGGSELVVIALIMLIIAGPQRMIRWAYVLGQFAGKMRDLWAQSMTVLQHELDEANVPVTLPKTPPTRQSINKLAQDLVQPLAQQVQAEFKDLQAIHTAPNVPSPQRTEPSAPATTPAEFGAWSAGQAPSASPSSAEFGAWSQGSSTNGSSASSS